MDGSDAASTVSLALLCGVDEIGVAEVADVPNLVSCASNDEYDALDVVLGSLCLLLLMPLLFVLGGHST